MEIRKWEPIGGVLSTVPVRINVSVPGVLFTGRLVMNSIADGATTAQTFIGGMTPFSVFNFHIKSF